MSQIKRPSSITVQRLVNTLTGGRKKRYLSKKKAKGSKLHKRNKPKIKHELISFSADFCSEQESLCARPVFHGCCWGFPTGATASLCLWPKPSAPRGKSIFHRTWSRWVRVASVDVLKQKWSLNKYNRMSVNPRWCWVLHTLQHFHPFSRLVQVL